MADDLEQALRSTLGEDPADAFVDTLRERVATEARQKTSAVDQEDLSVLRVDLRPTAEERPMTTRGLVAMVAAAIVLIVGIAVLVTTGGDGDDLETIETPEATTAAGDSGEPDETVAGSAADASAGCGLDESASITATVDESGEAVTFEIDFDPACTGVAVTLSGTPSERGLPITRPLTLDDTGAVTLTDQLLGTREGAQDWAVELIVDETGGVAATGAFTVAAVCDPEGAADLEATYLPESNEVDIVFTVDPVCAGVTFAFDDGTLFASSPSGGWNVYPVDDDGRIEITEELKADVGPIIGFAAQQAPERGILGGSPIVARATLDIGG
ncbi:MAG: hypothetical protein AAF480_08645 [Actinomycetota bacterium]